MEQGLLKLKAFEGAAYLDAFNEGQAMTIPDSGHPAIILPQ